jgi:DNA-binding transcriptional LysR family regulator
VDWEDLDAFCRVIESGGFTAAARAMNRPKSSVSAAVARLEAQLGARLLQRTTRRVRTTEAGESLYQDAAPMFQRLRELRLDAMALGKSVAGTLRIAAPYEFGAHHLGAVACTMLARYPDLRIELEVEHARVDPLDRRYDIVFSMFDDAPADSGRVARRVFALERGVFASPRLFERENVPRRPEDLADLPALAGLHDTEWSFTDGKGATVSVPIRPRLRSSNADVRRRAALAGLGVLRVVATFCGPALREGRLVRLLPEWTCAPLAIYALLPGRRLMPAKVREFLALLDEHERGAPASRRAGG